MYTTPYTKVSTLRIEESIICCQYRPSGNTTRTRENYIENLSSFSHIGVREEEGQKVLKINAELILRSFDPTLLLSVDRYNAMERKVSNMKEPFVLLFLEC